MSHSETCAQTATLVVLRHGQSAWTVPDENRFAGWVDVPLTDHGREQAARAGRLLSETGIEPDVAFTSVLGRSIETCRIILGELGRPWIPTWHSWRLNERHYGALQGQTRPDVRARLGRDELQRIRRSFDVVPPRMDSASPLFQGGDPRYLPRALEVADVSPAGGRLGGPEPACVTGESIHDVWRRLEPFWTAWVEPLLRRGLCVLVCTHGSVVRTALMRVEGLSPERASQVEVPTGVPLALELDPTTLRATRPARYLDPEAAQSGIEAAGAL